MAAIRSQMRHIKRNNTRVIPSNKIVLEIAAGKLAWENNEPVQ